MYRPAKTLRLSSQADFQLQTNETMSHIEVVSQAQSGKAVELSEKELDEITACGAQDNRHCPEWSCGVNHNETMVAVINESLTLPDNSSSRSDLSCNDN